MKFYRYEIVEYAVSDSEGEYVNPTVPNPKVEVREYDLLKETPKGYWVGYGDLGYNKYNWKKWVSKTSKKRFAYPTKEEALVNFTKRTEKRLRILDWQLQVCKISLNIVKNTDFLNEKPLKFKKTTWGDGPTMVNYGEEFD
jgi:hypothetical protein